MTIIQQTRRTLALLVLASTLHRAGAVGTEFTYQGRLEADGAPANGLYDLTFSVWTSAEGLSQLGATLTNSPVTVSNGLFTVVLDFGPGAFTGNSRWLEIGVRTNGGGAFGTLSPRQPLTPAPYAIYSGTAATVPNNSIGTSQIVTGGVTSPDILDGTIQSVDIADGAIQAVDLNLASVDARYVRKAGDTMTGPLATPQLTTSLITNAAGILSLISRTDIELMIDNGGGALAEFEIFNGAGSQVFSVSETGRGHTYGDHIVDGNFAVGTSSFDANAMVQFNLPSSNSVPHVRIKSPLSNAGFGLKFANPAETWIVGPNIGNWSDNRFNIMADGSNKGIIVATNGNVGIDSVSAAAPFTTLTVDGTIGFPTVATPAMYVYPSGTANANKPVIVHSPVFPGYGLYYRDTNDSFSMQSSPTDTTPSLVVDLDSNWVTIATDTPKPGYALSVNGRVVCEELLVQDMANWPDYVFKDDYKLRSLEEVETHIKEHKHLPGIPTADEVTANGVSIGDMQKRMMEKIEELTLYVIDQKKRLAAQEQQLDQLRQQLATRETR